MPIITQIICDGCGAVKRDVNHWYALSLTEQGPTIHSLASALDFEWPATNAANVKYFCGRRCTMAAVGSWMDGLGSRVEYEPQSMAEAGRGM
jgi:hypothetical protein